MHCWEYKLTNAVDRQTDRQQHGGGAEDCSDSSTRDRQYGGDLRENQGPNSRSRNLFLNLSEMEEFSQHSQEEAEEAVRSRMCAHQYPL